MWEVIDSTGVKIAAYLAKPVGKGPFPAVVVLQEIFGINAHIRSVAERLAQAGYLAVAPALFQRTAPALDIGYTPEEIAIGRAHKDKTTGAQILADVKATLAFLGSRTDVRGEKFGCVGFCFGGHVAFLAATLPEMDASASFYGAGIATLTPGGGAPTIFRAPAIHGEIELFFGTKDKSIPQDHVDKIEAALTEAGVKHAIHRYPAGHGFHCDQREDFDAASAKDAWAKTLDLFQRRLL